MYLVKLNRCSSSKQSQPPQSQHREAPKGFRLERRANR